MVPSRIGWDGLPWPLLTPGFRLVLGGIKSQRMEIPAEYQTRHNNLQRLRGVNQDQFPPPPTTVERRLIPMRFQVWMVWRHQIQWIVHPQANAAQLFHLSVEKLRHCVRLALEEIHCGVCLSGLGCGYPHHPAGVFAGFFVSRRRSTPVKALDLAPKCRVGLAGVGDPLQPQRQSSANVPALVSTFSSALVSLRARETRSCGALRAGH